MKMKESVKIDLTGDLLWKFRAIKQDLGVQQGTEAVRHLITEKYSELEREGKAPPRFSHFNIYEDHVTVRDNLDSDLYDVYVKDRQLYCERDKSFSCEHVNYAYTIEKVQDALRR